MRARVTFLLRFPTYGMIRLPVHRATFRIYLDFDNVERDWEKNVENGRVAFGNMPVSGEWNAVRTRLDGLKDKLVLAIREI